ERVQLELPRRERREHQHADTDQHLHRAGAAEQRQDPIDDDGDERHVEGVAPAEGARAHRAAPLTRSATRTASTYSATSYVRISAAPPSTAAAVAASDPASRAAGSRCPVMAPTNDLRETPTQSGRPSAASSGRLASTATSQACQATSASRK